jgi:predicted transcriptional regulator
MGKLTVAKAEAMTETLINGNISTFEKAVRGLTKAGVLELVGHMVEYGGYSYEKAIRACLLALD